VKLLRENISKLEIARYYLEIEFSKLFRSVDATTIRETIDRLSESKVWALLEAMSFTYHLNGVFFKLAREGYTWNEEIWNVEDILLTGMDSNVNKVTFSKELKYTKLIATIKDGKIAVLDGSHRLTEMFLNDTKEVHIFVGYPIKGIPEESKKTLVGNSTLILLTLLYKQGNEEEKKAVLTVVKEIIAKTLDGKYATQKYWVDNIYNDEFKKLGEDLLKECSKS